VSANVGNLQEIENSNHLKHGIFFDIADNFRRIFFICDVKEKGRKIPWSLAPFTNDIYLNFCKIWISKATTVYLQGEKKLFLSKTLTKYR
jgi:hypothetical protein